jgi:excisionase family DNA binding protein
MTGRGVSPGVSTFLSSGEIGRILGVSVATVRRWADAGLLPAQRTAGGHRRFSLSVAEQLAEQRGGIDRGLDGWIRLLVTPGEAPASALAVDAALLGERSRGGSWLAVAETMGGVLEELGARWHVGALSIIDEHVAAARLARALARAADALPIRPGGPRALLATAEGEAHTLGLALVELCVRERGWSAVWIGRDTSTEHLASRVSAGEVDVVAVSASVCRAPDELAAAAAGLAAACAARGVELVLGGRGPWPEQLAHGALVRTFAGLSAWMDGIERRARERGR